MWALRVVWILLPLVAGPAAAGALRGWSRAPRVLAETLLWLSWATVLVSVLAPRPLGLTAARVIAPAFLGVAIAGAWGASAWQSALAIAMATVAAVLVTRPAFARCCAEGIAYGDELRFPLKVPPALAVGAAPIATLLVAAGVATGPLLLASGHLAAGAFATVIGVPLSVFLFRSLHVLSMRWAVLVPAGVTLVDPMTLADPVLFMRERIAGITAAAVRPGDGPLDLRLGASVGALALRLTDDAQILTAGRGRRAGEKVNTHVLVFAPVEGDALLHAMARRAGQRETT
ncbi:MAG: hypothetical protein JOZ99_01615 [Actinobacteria bacterium]|nr:hypothetical protein [Actinomycetota bacterium]